MIAAFVVMSARVVLVSPLHALGLELEALGRTVCLLSLARSPGDLGLAAARRLVGPFTCVLGTVVSPARALVRDVGAGGLVLGLSQPGTRTVVTRRGVVLRPRGRGLVGRCRREAGRARAGAGDVAT